MTFPVTGILDNFNRVNEGPPPSANWTSPSLATENNRCTATVDGSYGHWSVETFDADSESYITIYNPTSQYLLCVRYRFVPTSDFYGIYWSPGTSQLILQRYDNSFATTLDTYSVSISAGDSIGIRCNGSTITGYYKQYNGNWTEILSATDATYNYDGYLRVEVGLEDATFDNFGGGALPCNDFVYTGNTGYEDTRPFTFLSLPRYAQILGLNPIQFFGATSSVVRNRSCEDTWFEFSYQDEGKVSRYEILLAIAQAESELIAQVGYNLAPYWTVDEKQDYPQLYLKEYSGIYGRQVGGQYKSVKTNLGYVLYGGQRATTQITDFVYCNDIDTDGDGFYDTAVFQVNGVDFNPCELKAYIKQYAVGDEENCRTDMSSVGADDAWEIRDIQIRYNETTEIALVYIKKWLLLKPQLQHAMDATVIDADDADSYVDTIEFWRVYNDPSQPVQFLWANERSCTNAACAWATQNGCMRVKDSRNGIVTLQPATYTDSTFSLTGFSQGIEPNKVRLWYYSGFQDGNARGCDSLSQWWALTIAMLATARLGQPVCSCENLVRKFQRWQEDVALANSVRTYNVNPADLNNPFGTRLGEILAWGRLRATGIKKGRNIKTY